MARNPKAATNGYDRDAVEQYLVEIDDADERLASLQSDYMTKCKGPRGKIAFVYEQAKEAGIPLRAFKTIVKNRRLQRQVAKNAAKLEDDDAQSYGLLVEALGDFVSLPLGQAALERNGGRPSAV